MDLLVVVAIIAILAVPLLAALNSVKLKANQSLCLNNVKQLSLASFMYASDNGRHIGNSKPDYSGGGNWAGTLMDYCAAQNKL